MAVASSSPFLWYARQHVPGVPSTSSHLRITLILLLHMPLNAHYSKHIFLKMPDDGPSRFGQMRHGAKGTISAKR
jgi:hypothetical protein